MKRIKQYINKLFSTGALHITVGSFVTKFVAFFGSIFVVRILTKEEYGLLGYVENLYSYALVFAGLGLPNAMLRFVVIAQGDKKTAYFKYIIKNSILRDFAIVALIIIANFFIPYPENFSEAKIWIPVLALLLPFQNLFNNEVFSLRALFKNKQYAYITCLSAVLLIVGRIVGAMIYGVGGLLWLRVLINAVFSITFFIYVYRFFNKSCKQTLSSQEVRETNIYALQYMITNGLWAIFMLNDTTLLGWMCDNPNILADYKVAYVLPGNLSIFATAIGVYIAPYFTKNENNPLWVRKNYKLAMLANIGVVGTVTVFMMIFARPLIVFIYGEQYANIVSLMQVLLIAAFLNSGIRYVSANLLSAMGRVKYNMIISAIGMAMQICFDILFIPHWGALGVAVSNCIVYLFMAVALFIIFKKTYYYARK